MVRDREADFDVIVVGAGHAGCEAAWAASGRGARTLLITGNIDRIAQLSCNPAVGGLAKGQIVREIDALGGVMGRVTDRAGIQFKLLNRSKGPAVRSLRAQVDKYIYPREMKKELQGRPKLTLFQGDVVSVKSEEGETRGVVTALGEEIRSRAVVITTGTFLNGLIHVGQRNYPGGRAGEPPALGLSESLGKLGHRIGRMKTGTPPRIRGSSIDFGELSSQFGDEEKDFFALETNDYSLPQKPCFLTYTNLRTHELIRRNLERSALYGGAIKGIGPRYCPSIEDKIVKFADRERHQVFLEPESLEGDEYYANGISTSLPIDVQREIVNSISGLEDAEITRPAYAIEYDFADPRDLKESLESRLVAGLFLAGQINGTSGYEEAAGQGLVAGVNAAKACLGREDSFILRRDQAYIGVLIDDLVTRGVTEPYRMFTSRAEYRLLLRHDNAHLRLFDVADDWGLMPRERKEKVLSIRESIEAAITRFRSTRVGPPEARRLFGVELRGAETLEKLLRRPDFHIRDLTALDPSVSDLVPAVLEQIEIAVKYEGYIQRQNEAVEKAKRFEEQAIPETLAIGDLPGLSREIREILLRVRPRTFGQARRVPGMTPAALGILAVAVAKHNRSESRAPL